MAQKKARFRRAVAKKNKEQSCGNWRFLAVVSLIGALLLLYDNGGISTNSVDLILAGIFIATFGVAVWQGYSRDTEKLKQSNGDE
jgi:hypothetical protein